MRGARLAVEKPSRSEDAHRIAGDGPDEGCRWREMRGPQRIEGRELLRLPLDALLDLTRRRDDLPGPAECLHGASRPRELENAAPLDPLPSRAPPLRAQGGSRRGQT